MTLEAVIVWRPVSRLVTPTGFEGPDASTLPRVFGASGLGAGVVEVDRLRWTVMTAATETVVGLPVVVVSGETQDARDAVVTSLVASYRSEVGGVVVFSDGSTESLGPSLLDIERGASVEGEEAPVLAVIDGDAVTEFMDGERWRVIAFLADEIEMRLIAGTREPRSMIVVLPVGDRSPWEEGTGPAAVTVFALESLASTEQAGARMAAALRGGVSTASGLSAAVAGAPVEWVRSFESGNVTAAG